jgi:ABC-type polysaccharide/polyol phosphate transport system ATPase subunit
MESTIICVENVSKRFPLHQKQISLRHEAVSLLKRWGRRQSPLAGVDSFYALKDVTFSINRGEAVAIIGRNGAGKSTLLRIISRIMRPTSGICWVKGRYVALFGLGVGFIPTMTGRDNIHLNAAMHGISPWEIEKRIDAIIDFSELGAFVEQPVKDYSSGMNARLGFSIAIHILPDIIFLDEVLAVGDAAFQKKCMQRIEKFKADKKTILYVSHSEQSIRRLCERALWLDEGRLVMDGPVNNVLQAYNARFSADPQSPS